MLGTSSVVSYVGISESGRCGYCKSTRRAKAKMGGQALEPENDAGMRSPSPETDEGEKQSEDEEEEEKDEGDSAVFGLWAHRLTVQAYQGFVDRGWRRSGRYLYKPIMERTCCPQYTIRLDVHKFRLSRTQKRALKAMYNFLKFDQKPSEKAIVKEEDCAVGRRNIQREMPKGKPATNNATSSSDKAKKTNVERQPKKKEIRRMKAEQRLLERGIDLAQYNKDRAEREAARRKTLQSFIGEYDQPEKTDGWKHKLEVRLVAQPSAEFDADFEEEFALFKNYQMQVHSDKECDISPNSFTRFLAASPLIKRQTREEAKGNQIPLGSYHQQYRIDGRIVAVGVVDILPRCLSAKYFFYDPSFAFLSFGTYSALREIAFTQQLARQRPQLHYYYMGFYLFDCPKMRYKGRFRPSDLLCDNCFQWVPLTECDRMLAENEGRFSTFHPGNDEHSRAEPTEEQLDQVRCILAQNKLVTFGQLRTEGLANDEEGENQLKELSEKVRNFVFYAGPVAAETILVL